MLVTVVCDNCNWKKGNQVVKDWLNVSCPVCGHKYIADNRDMSIYKTSRMIQVASSIIKFFMPWVKTKKVRIDTAKIKKSIDNQ